MTATNNARAIGASRFTFHASRTACQKSRLTLHVSRFTQSLLAPIDIASLAAFRFLFGLVMAGAMIRFMAKGWVRELYLAPALHFPYPGFEWIRPWPDALMYAHFISLVVLALGVALGIFYRVCAMLFFLGFTYVELLDQTAYLNHYYLISLLAGLLIVLPAHRAWSVDAWRKPRLRADLVPAWCLNILRFQIGVVYVFAGLAKFNADWLFRAQPLRIWLAARSDLPLIGHWLDQFWVACAASWFGAIFDASIVFFLLHRRTRRAAYIVLILFHVATWALFNIGMFPWIMIIAATVFLPPDWPRYWLKRISGKWIDEYAPPPVHTLSRSYAPTLVRSHALTLILALYVMVQLALPLRPWFSSQPSAWTCSGFNCAWRVMIAEKTGYAEFFACDPATGNRWRVSVQDYISQRQETMVAQDPYLIRTMGRRLADDLSREAGRPIQVTATSFATLNGRPSQQLINPNFDLAGPSGSGWIRPLAPLHRCVSRSAAVAK
jgi:hypothetical protein